MDLNKYWSLKEYSPRPEQINIIKEIASAMDSGYENIILEAGTGIGKSAIATTIANMVGDSYILTMTKQLQSQYLHDFKSILKEIKGRGNYPCNYHDTCKDCYVDEHNDINILKSMKKLKKCTDCSYRLALQKAQASRIVLTNYDYLWYSGIYANQWDVRDLLVLDESHNFEKKIMSLVSGDLNRKTIYDQYNFDIFYPVMQGNTLQSISSNNYWIEILEKLISIIKNNKTFNPTEIEKNRISISRYKELATNLESEDWLVELPSKKEILSDKTYKSNARVKGLKAELKPLMIRDYTDRLLSFGETRLFLTGTLGSKQRFCWWNGVDEDSTYYIYVKSLFPVEHRPIYKKYVKNMSGFTNKKPNWQDNNTIKKIREIIKIHRREKGVIHTSSNQQAWWIKKNISSRLLWVAQGSSREETIKRFENSDKPIVLIGAGIKDGVDFKGDKCRYQIIFKMPKPSFADKQTIIRTKKDPVWYAYQTVMPLMQAYGRGIRDMDDYCKTYILDSEFDNLLTNHQDLFNEYFLEAIQ